MHVVVLEERNPALEPGFPGVRVHALQHLLARLVTRMRLAGEHDLHRAPGVHQQPLQPIGIAENQVGPLVGGKPATEADREGFGIEQRPRAHEVQGFLPLISPAAPRLLPDAPHQLDRKSTRLNSSHGYISYAVFCLKKKKKKRKTKETNKSRMEELTREVA